VLIQPIAPVPLYGVAQKLSDGHFALIILIANEGRPHMSLGPGIPATTHSDEKAFPRLKIGKRHRFPTRCTVKAKPIIGGFHHEYTLEKKAA
jgi:hypothetical protein